MPAWQLWHADGYTWVCLACACSNADKEAKNADEKTAYEVAELNEQADVMALLK